MGRARSAPPRSFAATSTRRGSGLPAHADKKTAGRGIEAMDDLIVLVEGVLQARRDVEVPVVFEPGEQVHHCIGRELSPLEGRDIDVGTRPGSEQLAAESPAAEVAECGKRSERLRAPDGGALDVF